MKRIRKLPSPAMIVAVVALVFALAGTAVGAKKLLGLGAFRDGVKDKTVGVGKLKYVTNTVEDPIAPGITAAVATCPSNFEAVGGGIKVDSTDNAVIQNNARIIDSYMTSSGWAGHVETIGAPTTPTKFLTVVACVRSRAITGTPPTG
jgi:hypothetical protein